MTARDSYQPATEMDSHFSADDFFDNGEDDGYYYRPATVGTSATWQELEEEEVPLARPRREKRRNPKAQPGKRTRRRSSSRRKKNEGHFLRGLTRNFENLAGSDDMEQMKSRTRFFVCAGLIMIGFLTMILSYVQVFNLNSQISSLRSQLVELQGDDNAVSQAAGDYLNMNDLYSYATDTLGMVEADSSTTIRVKVSKQSYTTSSLPVEEISDSKVTFHWFR